MLYSYKSGRRGAAIEERLELLHTEITRHIGRLECGENSSLLVRWVYACGCGGGRGGMGVLRTGPVAAGVRVYSSVSHL